MTWRDAWRYAGPAYAEVAFQSIYALRQGNLLPSEGGSGLAETARRRVGQSKLLVTGVVSLLTLGALPALNGRTELLVAPGLDHGLYVTAVVAALLLLQLALLWWTGLQVLPTFLGSSAVPLLATLPLDDRTLRQVSLLVFLRLFDAPALACLIVTPVVVGVALGSVAAGLAIIPGTIVVVVFAMALALRTGEFFVRRVQGAHAGPGQTALRWAYLVLWAIPAFAMYGFLAVAPSFLSALATWSLAGPSGPISTVLATFPMPLGALTALAGAPTPLVTALGGIIVVSGAIYILVALWAVIWLADAPLALARALPIATLPAHARRFALVPRSVVGAIVTKDLRIASRVPGYAFVILLPLLDALALGLLTLASHPPASAVANFASAAVATSALLAIFFGPALFAIEVMGYGYVRTLPLSDRSMVASKVVLVAALYTASAGIVTVLSLPRLFAPLAFLAFIAAEAPAVIAAATFEFGVLFHRARRRGLPITNLYSGAWWAAAVAIPGVILGGFPLAVYQVVGPAAGPGALLALAATAAVELAVIGPVVWWVTGRRSP